MKTKLSAENFQDMNSFVTLPSKIHQQTRQVIFCHYNDRKKFMILVNTELFVSFLGG